MILCNQHHPQCSSYSFRNTAIKETKGKNQEKSGWITLKDSGFNYSLFLSSGEAFNRHQNLTVTCLLSPQNLAVNHVVERKTEKNTIRHCLATQSYYLCAGLTSLMSMSLFLKTVLLTQTPYRVIKHMCAKYILLGSYY